MKSFLLNINIFTLGFITVIVIPTLIISRYDNLDKYTSNNHNIVSLQTKSLYDSLDILFIGNSYCYSSINTKYLDSLNIQSFNLGIATAGVQFYDLVINDYFDNVSTSPRKVLVLVTPMTFSSKSDNFNNYPIHRYLENEKSNLEIAFKYNRLDKLVPVFKKSLEKAFVNIISRKGKHQDKQPLNFKGYSPSNKIVTKNIISIDKYFFLPLKNDIFDKSKIEDLLEIANRVKQRGSEVIFFELPTNLLNNYFSNRYLLDYKNGLIEINNTFKFISLDSSLFYENNYRNIDHMNSSGANIATKEIISHLNMKKERTHNILYK